MTFREEYNLLMNDAEYASMREHEQLHPLFQQEDRWKNWIKAYAKFTKTGGTATFDRAYTFLIDGLSFESKNELRQLRLVMADRAEELGCNKTATLLRGADSTDEEVLKEYSYPRSAWVRRFMRGV